jgi:hypothetical protein
MKRKSTDLYDRATDITRASGGDINSESERMNATMKFILGTPQYKADIDAKIRSLGNVDAQTRPATT